MSNFVQKKCSRKGRAKHFPEERLLLIFSASFFVKNDCNRCLTWAFEGRKCQHIEGVSARDLLSNDLLLLRLYVEMMGNGNPARIASSGFPLSQRAPRATAVLPAAPVQFRLVQGPVSGTIVAKARRVPSAGGYEVQLTAADPTVEANWSLFSVCTSCKSISIDGLTPGKTYSVRIRAVSNAGPGAWTSPASMMVI